MNNRNRSSRTCIHSLLLAAVLAVLMQPFTCAANDAMPSGYAALVRQVAPSVVTVMVEEQSVSAGARAAARVTADTGYDAVGAIIRRLLSGANGIPGSSDRPTGVLGSGFVIREDGLIVTNRHVITGARTVRIRLAGAREPPAKITGAQGGPHFGCLKVSVGNLPALRLGSFEAVSVVRAVIR